MGEALITRRGGAGGGEYDVAENWGANNKYNATNGYSLAMHDSSSSASVSVPAGGTATRNLEVTRDGTNGLKITNLVNWGAFEIGTGAQYTNRLCNLICFLLPEKSHVISLGTITVKLTLTAKYDSENWYICMEITNNGTTDQLVYLSGIKHAVVSVGNIEDSNSVPK